MTDRRPSRFCSSQKKSDPRPGDARLREVVARTRRKRSDARDEDPKPYDPAWGWWIESRIARLENGQTIPRPLNSMLQLEEIDEAGW